MRLVTAQQMRELDRRAAAEGGVPSLLLMENAGRGVFNVACGMLGSTGGKRVAVIAGKGNNGGDGYVAAGHLANAGMDVRVYLIGDPAEIKGDAATNLENVRRGRIPLTVVAKREDIPCLREYDLIVDALLGTGIRGEVVGLATKAIAAINSAECPVLAVDVPSGIDADTGGICGVCVKADTTVTFALPKLGLLLYPAAEFVGELTVVEIGIPEAILDDSGSKVSLATPEFVVERIPERAPDAHKGTFGHLAVLAGSVGMTGAAAMAAEAALRAGVGLVTVGVPESLNDILEVKLTEAMTLPIPQGAGRHFGLDSVEPALELVARCDAVAIGPGIGRDPETIRFVHDILPRITKPLVIDADGLNALAEDVSTFAKLQAPAVITPHPGELARLLGTDAAAIQSKRLEIAVESAARWGVVVVLKGARTIAAEPGGEAFVNPTGNPGMASGGVGDVLTGVIGAFLAQGMSVLDAGVCGAYLHGLAGDLAASEIGEVSLIAGDVLDSLPEAFQQVIRGE